MRTDNAATDATEQPPILLTLRIAARDLSISIRTLEREIADGKIGVTMIRGRPRIARAEVAAYIERSTRTRGPQACPSEDIAQVGRSASRLAAAELNELLAERRRTPRLSKQGFEGRLL
jgi:excisionase family DNA binding protein